mmetsp:Transcript_78454/g.197107  ORF Transcript_78454/g.197107 Transcript_78454/m.197107 type:complete len:254 (+) Transcript_78454:791-1552(+)
MHVWPSGAWAHLVSDSLPAMTSSSASPPKIPSPPPWPAAARAHSAFATADASLSLPGEAVLSLPLAGTTHEARKDSGLAGISSQLARTSRRSGSQGSALSGRNMHNKSSCADPSQARSRISAPPAALAARKAAALAQTCGHARRQAGASDWSIAATASPEPHTGSAEVLPLPANASGTPCTDGAGADSSLPRSEEAPAAPRRDAGLPNDEFTSAGPGALCACRRVASSAASITVRRATIPLCWGETKTHLSRT